MSLTSKKKMFPFPIVSSAVAQELCEAAISLGSLSPWTKTHEEELFAVYDPKEKQIHYCSILGSGGTFYGLSTYRGRKGLELFFRQKEKKNPYSYEDTIAIYDSFLVEFSSKKVLDKQDLSLIKELPPSFFPRSLYPSFRSCRPGYQAWYLSEEDAALLTQILCAARFHIACIEQEKTALNETSIPLYTPKRKSSKKKEWESSQHVIPPLSWEEVSLNDDLLLQMAKLKQLKLCLDGVWEASIFVVPVVIEEGNAPRFLHIALIIHQETGSILQTEAVSYTATPAEAICLQILSTIEKTKRLPSEILTDSEECFRGLKPFARALGVQPTLAKELPVVSVVKQEMINRLC